MTSYLLLQGPGSGAEDRRPLDEHDREVLGPVLRGLVQFAADPDEAAIAHERDGRIVGAWNREGASRLARSLPSSYAELARAISNRHGSPTT